MKASFDKLNSIFLVLALCLYSPNIAIYGSFPVFFLAIFTHPQLVFIPFLKANPVALQPLPQSHFSSHVMLPHLFALSFFMAINLPNLSPEISLKLWARKLLGMDNIYNGSPAKST